MSRLKPSTCARGRVLARVCGVEFSPLRAWRSSGSALPGEPFDPAQTCPECYRRSGLKTPGQGCGG